MSMNLVRTYEEHRTHSFFYVSYVPMCFKNISIKNVTLKTNAAYIIEAQTNTQPPQQIIITQIFFKQIIITF